MRPAGLAEVERAKADGRWDDAYAPPSRMEVPDDLRAALDAVPAAAEAFAALSKSRRYGVLFRIHDAKRPRRGRGGSRRTSTSSRAASRVALGRVPLGALVLAVGLAEHPDEDVRERDPHHDRLLDGHDRAGERLVLLRREAPERGCSS
jgi:hypothetical protein